MMNVISSPFQFAKPLIPLSLREVFFIVLHHAEARNISPEEIHQAHINKGWSGIGYNEYIRKSGDVFIGRGDFIGAHCRGWNSHTFGICLEGDFNFRDEAEEFISDGNPQKEAMLARIEYHLFRFRLMPEAVVLHRTLCDTDCPGEFFPFKHGQIKF